MPEALEDAMPPSIRRALIDRPQLCRSAAGRPDEDSRGANARAESICTRPDAQARLIRGEKENHKRYYWFHASIGLWR